MECPKTQCKLQQPDLHGDFDALIRDAHGNRMLTDPEGVSIPDYYSCKGVYCSGEDNVRTQFALRVDCRWCLQQCNSATVGGTEGFLHDIPVTIPWLHRRSDTSFFEREYRIVRPDRVVGWSSRVYRKVMLSGRDYDIESVTLYRVTCE